MSVITLRADKGSPLTHNEVDDNFRNLRSRLTADRIYYVNYDDGDNDNDGLTAGTAWKTIQYAINYIADNIDVGGYLLTVQLSAGTHIVDQYYAGPGEIFEPFLDQGLQFKDPIGGVRGGAIVEALIHAETTPCKLRGDPANPDAYIISAGPSGFHFQLMSFDRSRAWTIEGVKLQVEWAGYPTAYTMVWLYFGSAFFNECNFCFVTGMSQGNYAFVDCVVTVYGGKISANTAGLVDPVNDPVIIGPEFSNIWRIDQRCLYYTSGTHDCTHARIQVDTFLEVVGACFTFQQSGYSNYENITTVSYNWLCSTFAHINGSSQIPGTCTPAGYLGADCSVSSYGAAGVVTGEMYVVPDPLGLNLGHIGGGTELLGPWKGQGQTFSNEGAVAMTVWELPAYDPTFHIVGANPHVHSFVVQNAIGVRVTVPTGHTIRVGNAISADGGMIESIAIGSTLTIKCINLTEWFVTDLLGTWTLT